MNNTELMQQALVDLVAGDPAKFLALFHDDIVWTVRGTTSWAGDYRGKKAVRAVLRQVASHVEGTYRLAYARVVAEGEYIVVETQGNNLLRTGERYDNQYCWLCKFEQHKLRELIEYGDTALNLRVLPAYSPEAEA